MKVGLICYTPNPERTVAMSARLCYSAIGAEQLAGDMSEEQVERLVKKIINLGHYSTLEHVSFTFAVEGVSRVLTHQLVRHRLASYSQQSQRYVAEHDFEYILPPSIQGNTAAAKVFTDLMTTIREAYISLSDMGIPKEDARYCLANATETKIVITMNARELLHFFRLRCCARAQWEIRALANKMLQEAKSVAPLLFVKAGPSCVADGFCSEGDMTCGRLERIKQNSDVKGEGD